MHTKHSSLSGSEPLRGLAAEIVAADGERQSWREKLAWVHELLAASRRDLALDDLVDLAVYLRFLATGEIPCREDGHHYRPSHHATTAQKIWARLWALRRPDNALVLRKIYPYLPSFGPEFTRREPLTRIRDIAHRNDIPSQLKREIKHTLQNKLHRCAGPEDLATSAALLERITADESSYSAGFVEQFKIFHAELKEFFSARSLGEQLDALSQRCDVPGLAEIMQGVAGRLREEAEPRGERATSSELLDGLDQLTRLREGLVAQLGAADEVWRQQCQLADISAEEHAFVLLSELNNALQLPDGEESVWELALDGLALSLDHLRLAQVSVEEVAANAADIREWRRTFSPRRREDLLRVRAALQRCCRLAGEQTDAVLGLFARRVEAIGRALDVPEHAIRTFCEADLRANLLFQMTRLADWLGQRVRETAGLSPWAPVVPGRASGRLTRADRLPELEAEEGAALIGLIASAEGDETIPAGVAGLLVGHEIPQLSHLAVRARQRGIPFSASDDEQATGELSALVGEWVSIHVNEDGATIRRGDSSPPRRQRAPRQRQQVLVRPTQVAPSPVVSLSEDVGDIVGGKASSLARLSVLAQQPGAEFGVPEALVVPLGVMEGAIQRQASLWSTYRRLVQRAEEADEVELSEVCEQLRSLIRRLDVPPEVGREVMRVFSPSARLIVRSSANCEDLAELAGAGLYDSVANVPPARVSLAVRAVWASLWSNRAALNRRAEGIAQGDAQMAVLIQRLVQPEWSFFLHTVNPLSGSSDEIYVELAVGLGDTLAAASRGTPFRWVCDKRSGETSVVAFPSLSTGLFAQETGELRQQVISYARQPLCRDERQRQQLGRRICAIGAFLNQALGRPQDIEGVIRADELFVVQARAQQGVVVGPEAAVGSAAASDPTEQATRPSRPNKQPQRAAVPRRKAQRVAELSAPPGVQTEAAIRPGDEEPRESADSPISAEALDRVQLLALFEKRIDGDDTLLQLAERRCAEADLGIEIHPLHPDHLDHLLGFRPASDAPVVVHLPRTLDLLRADDRQYVVQMAERAAGRVHGFVAHDQRALVEAPQNYADAVAELHGALHHSAGTPLLFIEYAVGLEPERFVGFFEQVVQLERVSACVDTGHVGIRQLQRAFARVHAEPNPCRLTPYDGRLERLLPALEGARKSCLGTVVQTIRSLARLGKPLHFHLHDGHPLWTLSPYGVSDHISFLETISIPFEFEGRRTLDPMFGPNGLAEIVSAALQLPDSVPLSMTLEIHPMPGRLPLDDVKPLFRHWRDKRNAEQMNYWLAVIRSNAELIRRHRGDELAPSSRDST